MAKLEVKDNKKLVLKSVICKKLHDTKVEDVDQEINKFHQHLQLLKAQIFGPLILSFIFKLIMLNSTVTFMMYRILSLFHIVYMFVLKTVQSIYSMRILNWIYMSMKMIFKRMGLSIQFMLILLLKKW